jgi:hypothetical protein
MANKLTWQSITTIQNVSHYNIYRSIIGVVSQAVENFALSDGMLLTYKLSDNIEQTIVFDDADFVNINTATAAEVADVLNSQGIGIWSHYSYELPGKVYIRTTQKNETLQITGGSANTILGFSTENISEKSHFIKIAEVAHQTGVLEYTDQNGRMDDWYQLTTVDLSSNESMPTIPKQAGAQREPICVVTGKIITGDGYRLADKEIKGKIEFPPKIAGTPLSGIDREAIVSYSRLDGTFELELLQGAIYFIEIPSIEFARKVLIPEEQSANLFSLETIEKTLVDGGEDII